MVKLHHLFLNQHLLLRIYLLSVLFYCILVIISSTYARILNWYINNFYEVNSSNKDFVIDIKIRIDLTVILRGFVPIINVISIAFLLEHLVSVTHYFYKKIKEGTGVE